MNKDPKSAKRSNKLCNIFISEYDHLPLPSVVRRNGRDRTSTNVLLASFLTHRHTQFDFIPSRLREFA